MLLEYDLDRYSMGNFMECWWKPSGHQTISNKACWKTHHFNIYILMGSVYWGIAPIILMQNMRGSHHQTRGLMMVYSCWNGAFIADLILNAPPMFGTQTWIFLYICICSIDPIFSQGFVSGGIRFNTRGKRLGNVVNPLRTHFFGHGFSHPWTGKAW